ncbi:MAG TPA: leucine-rich repeat domain-containing protein, partial [Lachnospiraceae bacterium]|nr:leucine-rich repeat domain-containing protein [Lachnospiraceae bacterium]
DSNAFDNCNFSKVIIPNSVTKLGTYVFSNNDELQEVWLPSGLVKVKNNTFSYCPKLTKIHIPDSVKTIESKAFYSWSTQGSQTIYCSPKSAAYDFAVENGFHIELE